MSPLNIRNAPAGVEVLRWIAVFCVVNVVFNIYDGSEPYLTAFVFPLSCAIALWLLNPAGWIFLTVALFAQSVFYAYFAFAGNAFYPIGWTIDWAIDKFGNTQLTLWNLIEWFIVFVSLLVAAIHIDNNKKVFTKNGEMQFPWWKPLIILWAVMMPFLPMFEQKARIAFDSHAFSHEQHVVQIAFSADGKDIAAAVYKPIRFVLRGEHPVLYEPPEIYVRKVDGSDIKYFTVRGEPQCLAYSPDGHYLAVGRGYPPVSDETDDAYFDLWDLQTGQLIDHFRRPPSKQAFTKRIAFSPDSKHLAVWRRYGNGTIEIWDIQTGKVMKSFITGTVEFDVVDFKNNKYLANSLYSVNALSYSPDGRYIAAGGSIGLIGIWDAQTGQHLKTLTSGRVGDIEALAFSPDGRCLVSGFNKHIASPRYKEGITVGTLEVWEPLSGKLLHTVSLDTEDTIRSLAFSPDGRRVIAGGGDNILRVWETAGWKLVKTYKRPPSQGLMDSVAYSPDGRFFAAVSRNIVKLWRVEE